MSGELETNRDSGRTRAVLKALVYLQLSSMKGRFLGMIKRLRNPRYLAGFAAGLAYFYYFFLRHVFNHTGMGKQRGLGSLFENAQDWVQTAEPIAAFGVLGMITLFWLFRQSSAALAFTEAEIAFLFPAPVSRTTLIHFKLIKAQLTILFTVLLFSLFSQKLPYSDTHYLMHALGWWLMFSILNLHSLGVAFTQARLIDLGMRPWLRRLIGISLVLLVVGISGVVMWNTVPSPAPGHETDILPWVKGFLGAPPLCWILKLSGLVVKPFFAQTTGAWLLALPGALVLLVLHYFWAIRAQVSFEEASLTQAQKIATTVERVRKGSSLFRVSKRRQDPFKLRSTGPHAFAFLWKGLLGAGFWGMPRNWLIFGGLVIATVGSLLSIPSLAFIRPIFSVICAGIGAYILFLVPLMSQRGIPALMQRMEVVKSYPLPGWKVVLGEMLTPIVMISVLEWVLLGCIGASGLIGLEKMPSFLKMLLGPGLPGLALLVPLFLAVSLSLPFAGALYFPAWLSVNTSRSIGLDVMGQRMLFSAGVILTMLLAALPATLFGSVPFLLFSLFTESQLLPFYSGVLTAAAVLAGELVLIFWWLGQRYERFDISLERSGNG